jgi:hypothetical protein
MKKYRFGFHKPDPAVARPDEMAMPAFRDCTHIFMGVSAYIFMELIACRLLVNFFVAFES